MRGNKYEILEFVYRQMLLHIGFEALPPKVSALKGMSEKEKGRDDESEDLVEEIGERDNAGELPEKIDMFVEYINKNYFDGELDTGSKDMLKKKGRRRNDDDDDRGEPKPRRIFMG